MGLNQSHVVAFFSNAIFSFKLIGHDTNNFDNKRKCCQRLSFVCKSGNWRDLPSFCYDRLHFQGNYNEQNIETIRNLVVFYIMKMQSENKEPCSLQPAQGALLLSFQCQGYDCRTTYLVGMFVSPKLLQIWKFPLFRRKSAYCEHRIDREFSFWPANKI